MTPLILLIILCFSCFVSFLISFSSIGDRKRYECEINDEMNKHSNHLISHQMSSDWCKWRDWWLSINFLHSISTIKSILIHCWNHLSFLIFDINIIISQSSLHHFHIFHFLFPSLSLSSIPFFSSFSFLLSSLFNNKNK